MAEITVRVAMNTTLLPPEGSEFTVEQTAFVDGLVRSGALQVLPAPVPPGPAAGAAASRLEPAPTASGRRRRVRSG